MQLHKDRIYNGQIMFTKPHISLRYSYVAFPVKEEEAQYVLKTNLFWCKSKEQSPFQGLFVCFKECFLAI